MTVATTYEHIALDDKGSPVVVGTRTKVIEIALAQRAHGMSPEELSYQLPHLTLGQIHSALAYYWDHKEALDLEIQQRASEMEELRRKLQPVDLLEKLKTRRAG